MDINVNVKKDDSSFLLRFFSFFKSDTAKYIYKRIINALITILLIVIVVTALMYLIPENYYYDIQIYNKLLSSAGLNAAESYKLSELAKFGRTGGVLENIGTYLYWICPIYKEIPLSYIQDASGMYVANPNDMWTGFIYLGQSYKFAPGEAVSDLLASRVGISFSLTFTALLISYLIAYPLGISMAKNQGKVVDKLGNLFVVLNYAIPALVFYLIINQFAPYISSEFKLYYSPEAPLSIIPPIFAISFLSIPGISVWVRRFMVDELSADYVKFARAKGLSENTIMYKHVLRNAFVPLVRNIPVSLVSAIVGSYYVESIWNIPGTGLLLTGALKSGQNPDTFLVLSLALVYSSLSIVAFLVGDIVTSLFDPRIKLTSAE